MDLDTVDDDTLDQLADRLAERLDPGAYGDRVVLSRRQLVGVATGVLGTGALMRLGVDPAAAQAAGSVGTSSDPVDVFAYDVDVQNGVSMNGTDITNAGSVSTTDFNADPEFTNTISLNPGETLTGVFLGNTSPSDLGVDDVIVPFAFPANEPGNDHGYSIEIYHDTNNDRYQANVTETENSGGGDVKIGFFIF